MSTDNAPDEDHRPAHDRALDEQEHQTEAGAEGRTEARTGREPGGADARAAETPFTQQLGRIFVAIIAVLFGVFAVANAQFVDFNWIFGRTEVEVAQQGGERVGGGVPLIILLVASFVLGALAGWFATWRRKRHGRGGP